MRIKLGQTGVAIRVMIVMTVVLGLGYPLLVMGIGQAAFPSQANGSLIYRHGQLVGSSLIGQDFGTNPRYFWSRPSAAGSGYDPTSTGASNLALDNPVLIGDVRQRRAAIAKANGVALWQVPADAVMASGSGLDPQISPAYAAIQVDRVARARHLPTGVINRLVAAYTQGRTLGFLGEPRVNVVQLNLALDAYQR